MPTVSIILPTYNRASIIMESVQSILDQTYEDYELIIVDDGSKDNTEEIIKRIPDKRVRYIRHETNMGAQAARNTGIRASAGKYIAFQDSDDIWVKDKLEKQMNAFDSAPPEVGIVYTGYMKTEHGVRRYGPSPDIKIKDGDVFETLLRDSLVSTPAALIKRECFDVAGMFDESLPDLHDWELSFRLAMHYHFKFIDEPLVIKYVRPDSITVKPEPLIKAWDIVLKKYSQYFKNDKKLLIYRNIRMGRIVLSRGGYFKSWRYFFKAAFIDLSDRENFSYCVTTALFGKDAYQNIKQFKKKCKKFVKNIRAFIKTIYSAAKSILRPLKHKFLRGKKKHCRK